MCSRQLSPGQHLGLLHLADVAQVWSKRQRYGRFRPPGWRTQLELLDAVQQPPLASARQAAWAAERMPASASRARSVPVSGRATPVPGSLHAASRLSMQLAVGFDEDGLSDWQHHASGLAGGHTFLSRPQTPVRPAQLSSSLARAGSADLSSSLRPSPSPRAGAVPATSFTPVSGTRSARVTHDGTPAVTWTHVWRYAIRAVLYNLREQWRVTSAPPAIQVRHQLRNEVLQALYVALYKRKLEGLRAKGGAAAAGVATGRNSTSPGQSARHADWLDSDGDEGASEAGGGLGEDEEQEAARRTTQAADAAAGEEAPKKDNDEDLGEDGEDEGEEFDEGEEWGYEEEEGFESDEDDGEEEEGEDAATAARKAAMQRWDEELGKLEDELDVGRIVHFRALAEAALQEQAAGTLGLAKGLSLALLYWITGSPCLHP